MVQPEDLTGTASRTGAPAPAWTALAVVAGGYLVLQALVAARYGFHRDELYFLEASRHLALGYVDQPPLVPMLARVQTALFGDAPWALRVVPALAGAGTTVLGGLLARELGGARRAQLWAATATASAGLVLATGHLLSTSTFDLTAWLALLVIAARLLRTDDPRLWVAYGLVAGLALWNKHLPILLTIALLAGLVADRRWSLLAARWLLTGGLVAAVLIAPHVWWQATNGWPQLEMVGALSERIGGENRATLVPLQLLLVGPFVVPLAVAGTRWLLRDGRAFRVLLWTYLAALVLTFVSGGRPYYPLPLALSLVVAGSVALAPEAPRHDVPPARRGWGVPVALGLNLAVALPLSLPILPVAALAETPIGEINDTLVEQIGWPELATQVAGVVASLPADEADRVVLLTGTYGEAGALDRYGPEVGLPEVYSGHNSYWHWRRPADDRATVVAVRVPMASLERVFGSCTLVGTVDNGRGIDNEAQGAPITVCHDLRGTWDQRWPDLRHVS